jgi:hypothetical protein
MSEPAVVVRLLASLARNGRRGAPSCRPARSGPDGHFAGWFPLSLGLRPLLPVWRRQKAKGARRPPAAACPADRPANWPPAGACPRQDDAPRSSLGGDKFARITARANINLAPRLTWPTGRRAPRIISNRRARPAPFGSARAAPARQQEMKRDIGQRAGPHVRDNVIVCARPKLFGLAPRTINRNGRPKIEILHGGRATTAGSRRRPHATHKPPSQPSAASQPASQPDASGAPN